MDESTQRCRVCSGVLPVESFSIRRETGRPRSECRSCIVDKARAWRQDNRERSNVNDRAAHRRARVNPISRAQELERDGQRRRAKNAARPPVDTACERCSRPFTYVRKAGRQPTVCRPCRKVDWAWKLYGLHSVTLPAFYEAHGNCCGICGGTDSPTQWGERLHIDHDHTTGVLRGLLCTRCNTGLGSFADDPARLLAAADYLARRSQ